MLWMNEVPQNLLWDLKDGRDYYKTFSTGGRASTMALIGWMAEKLIEYEKLIDGYKIELAKADKLNEELITHGIKELNFEGIPSDPT